MTCPERSAPARAVARVFPRRSGPSRPDTQPQAPPPPKSTSGVSAHGALILGFLTLALLLGGFGLWATSSRISGAVLAQGQVEVDRHRQVVQHPDGGVVAEILVKDGDPVRAGQVLIRLDGEMLRSERAIVEGQFYELLARRGRLEAERSDSPDIRFPPDLLAAAQNNTEVADMIAGQRDLFSARKETLSKSLDQIGEQLDQTEAQISGIDAQRAALTRQRELIGKELADQQSLFDRGLAQASRVLALKRESASLDGEVGELTAQHARYEGRLSELRLERLRLTSERRENAESGLRDIGYHILELAERRRSLSGQIDRLDLRAPVGGVVYDMAVTTPRAVLRAADPALYIVPQDRPLVVEARISPLNIDEVSPGQPVMLRFPAFSARTTPELHGTLTRISADALTDPTTHASYYSGEVSLLPGEETRLGDRKLLPGMPVEVYLRSGERSPLAYLLKPFTDYFSRAFREN